MDYIHSLLDLLDGGFLLRVEDEPGVYVGILVVVYDVLFEIFFADEIF